MFKILLKNIVLLLVIILQNCINFTPKSVIEKDKEKLLVDTIFSIVSTHNTKVNWRNSELITSDHISYFGKDDFKKCSTGFETKKDNKNWTVINCWGDNLDLPFRKELGVSSDGNTVELTIQLTQPAYKHLPGVDLLYTFKIPLKTVVNMNWTAMSGPVYKSKTVSGKLTTDSPEDFIGGNIRWLAFIGEKKNLVFDFNPEGMQTYSDVGPNYIQGLWSIKKIGDYLECSFSAEVSFYGGTLNSKVVIFEGQYSDYVNRHAYDYYNYYFDLPVNKAFCFGAPKHGEQYVQAGNNIFNRNRSFGWLNSDIKLDTLRTSGALYSSAYGCQKTTFISNVDRKGLYLITARIGTGKTPTGPMSLNCLDKNIVDNISIDAHTVKTITWSQWLEDGEVRFTFDGNWRISTIALQMLQHTHEDYKFRRGFWRISNIYEPSVNFKNVYFEKPANFAVAISTTPLPIEIIEDIDKAIVLPKGNTSLPEQMIKEMTWRFNANIGSLGPNNSGNFDEFNTPELIERRIKELKEKNIDVIVLNGLLSRHTFPNHKKRLDKIIPMIVKEAHHHGIKVIDHLDLTLLWNMGSGFRVLTQHPEYLQRTVKDNLPTTLFCPVNQKFKEQFFDWLIEHIKKTNIDGYMIDEQNFGGTNYCGCADCRKEFHEATGLTLPMDETSPILENKDSKLWQSWQKWRIKVLGDWIVELKERTNEINPNLTHMRYTTHRGFSSDYSVLKLGASLAESARACDFLGTEIMSRNVYFAYRSVFSYRKLKYSLREAYNSPIFGLIYANQSPEVAYFGWCINSMNNESTWQLESIPENSTTPVFTAFREGMNRQLAKPKVSIAMLFSTQSSIWSGNKFYHIAPLGFGETMNDMHYQYTVLIEESLNLEKLKQYENVIVPDATCLSNEQIDVLLKYAEQGGNLLLTANTGMADAIGNKRTLWPFAEVLGISNPLPKKNIVGGKLVLNGSGKSIESKLSFIEFSPDGTKEINEFLTLHKSDGTKKPVGITVSYGDGSISYISGRIGELNVEDEQTVKQEWLYEWSQNEFEFQQTLFNQLLGTTFKSINIPRKVYATVYEQPMEEGNYTIVHLLNATGSNMREDEIISQGVPSVPFPKLSQNLKFKIKLSNKLKDSFVASPDFEGHKSLITNELENGWYEVTLPLNLLKCYSLIWLKQ